MARIAGIEIPDDKKVSISLTYIYGIGETTSKKILESVGMDGDRKMREFSESELNILRKYIEENYEVEGELRQMTFRNIKRLKDIKSYRGVRHKIGLPVRGQRTRVNARTRKGKSAAVGGLKQKITKT